MIVLVDFENTHQNGFEGYEYLNDRDTLVVYYSDENSALPKGMVDDLKEWNVDVKMVKLLKQHSNALDMYIASTTGMYLENGEKICIVSKDKGYAAVRDFWHSLRGAEIMLGETIEECFLHSVHNDDERIRNAKERSQRVLLTQAFETMNKVPTRPTLSRGYQRRRVQLDTRRNLEPVELLPNPLARRDNAVKDADTKPQDIEPVQQETENAEAPQSAYIEQEVNVTAAAELYSETVQPDSEIAEKIDKEPEATALKLPATRENAISYVYDPVTRTMKQLGAQETESSDESESETRKEAAETASDAAEKPVHKKRRRRKPKASSKETADAASNDTAAEALPDGVKDSQSNEEAPAAKTAVAEKSAEDSADDKSVEKKQSSKRGAGRRSNKAKTSAKSDGTKQSKDEASESNAEEINKKPEPAAEEKPEKSSGAKEKKASGQPAEKNAENNADAANTEKKPRRRGRKPKVAKAQESTETATKDNKEE